MPLKSIERTTNIQFLEIIPELDAILGSRAFVTSPILSRFLKFIVDQKIAWKENELKEYTIGVEVLGRPPGYNPRLDASVRIHANRLRKLLNAYYETSNPVGMYRVELLPGSYCPVFSIIHDPILVTGESKFVDQKENNEDSICILPFGILRNGGQSLFPVEDFCELLDFKLSQFQEKKVIPYEKVAGYLKNGGNTKSLGKALGVKYHLSGSLQFEKNKLVVSVHLFRSDEEAFITSLSYQEEVTEDSIYQVIENITSKISCSVADYPGLINMRNFAIGSVAGKPFGNAVYWHYRFLTENKREVFQESLLLVEQAVKEDPFIPQSWAILGHLLASGVIYNYLPATLTLERSLECASRSLELNPNCQHGHLAMAWVNVFLRKKEKALLHFRKCISVNPNSSYFKTAVGLGLALCGEYPESLEILEKAGRLNPLPAWWINLPAVFVALKQHDYLKMLFYCEKISTPRVVFENIFEMIALYYLGDKITLQKMQEEYNKMHPGGLDFVIKTLPAILYDDDLINLIVKALTDIKNIPGYGMPPHENLNLIHFHQ